MIGTIRNTTKVSDMTRAIWRPEYRSRTTERVTVTQAAARPCTKRQASSALKLPVRLQTNAATTYRLEAASKIGRLPNRSDIKPQNS